MFPDSLLNEISTLIRKLDSTRFEMGSARPSGEGPAKGGNYSLLMKVTRGCPWRLCSFCYGLCYGERTFHIRTIKEIKEDINNINTMVDVLKKISDKLGYYGVVNEDLVRLLFNLYPKLKGNTKFINVASWLCSSGKSVFLQDADPLIVPVRELLEIIRYLMTTFLSVRRIASYANSRTILKRSVNELRDLNFSRVYVGLETGDDKLLKYFNTGVTVEEHIEAGRRIIEAGMELSEYVIIGLGGKAMSGQHAKNTAEVLDKINPHYVRMQTLVPLIGTPLYESYARGEFKLLSPHECLMEVKIIIEDLNVNGKICFDHIVNPSLKDGTPIFRQDYEGYKLPEEKATILETIDKALKIDESRFRWTEGLIGKITPEIV